jgi:hypothetical protein
MEEESSFTDLMMMTTKQSSRRWHRQLQEEASQQQQQQQQAYHSPGFGNDRQDCQAIDNENGDDRRFLNCIIPNLLRDSENVTITNTIECDLLDMNNDPTTIISSLNFQASKNCVCHAHAS